MARVDVVGEKIYREELSAQGFISPFSYKEGTIHESAILKVASSRDNLQDFKIGKLPSWIFVEDVLGVTPTINEISQQGVFDYNVRESAEDNITKAIMGVNGAPGIDLNEFLANSDLVVMYMGADPGITQLVESGDRQGVMNWVNKFLPQYKENFIKTRTQLLVAFGATVTTNVKDSYRKGTINLDNKEDKIVARYFRLTDAIMKKKFEEDTKMDPSEAEKNPKDYRKKYSEYLFKAKEPLTRSRSTGIIYMATREVIIYNGAYLPKADESNSSDFHLKYYTLSSSKYKKIAIRRSDPKIDTELDYVMFRFEYMGKTKAEAGRDMAVLGQDTRLKPDEVYDLFYAALPEMSYKKCYDLQEYPIDEIVGTVTEFLTENSKYLDRLTGEEKEKLGDAIDIVNGAVKKEDMNDIMNEVASMFSNAAATVPMQQAVQPQAPQQAPVQQQVPVQQPVQQQAPVQQTPQQAPQMGQQPGQQAPVQPQVPGQQQVPDQWAFSGDINNIEFPQF